MIKAHAHSEVSAFPPRQSGRIELTCRTDSLAALRAAVDHGASSIRLRWRMRDEPTGTGHSEFQRAGLKKAVQYAHSNGCSVSLELAPGFSTPASAGAQLNRAFEAGIEDIALSSQALALYLASHHPSIRLRLIVTDVQLSRRALMLIRVQLGITRISLPPVVSLAHLSELSGTGTELEVQATGAGCAIIASESHKVRRAPAASHGDSCSDGTVACNDSAFLCTPPDASVALSRLPQLAMAGVQSVLIETTGRSPARMAQLTHDWRRALDQLRRAPVDAGAPPGAASDAA